jgi:hypothetical protein
MHAEQEPSGDSPPNTVVLSTRLTNDERGLITSGQELDDNITTKAMRLIMAQVPHLNIQPTSLSAIPEQLTFSEEPTMFVHHTGAQHHFVMSTSAGGVIRTYDSLNLDPSTSLRRQVAAIYIPNGDNTSAGVKRVQHMIVSHEQQGSADCGVFAIAYATEIAMGSDPEEVADIWFRQGDMRSHLAAAFDAGHITRFPRVSTGMAIGDQQKNVQIDVITDNNSFVEAMKKVGGASTQGDPGATHA